MRKLIILIACIVSSAVFARSYQNLHISITPGIWGLNMSGHVQVSNKAVHVNQNNPAGMLAIAISQKHLLIFGDAIYMQQTEKKSLPGYSVKVSNNFGIFSLGLGYRYINQMLASQIPQRLLIAPYLGARYTEKTTDLDINNGLSTTRHRVNWVDPLIGILLKDYFYDRYFGRFSFDIGGVNTSSQYSYRMLADVGLSVLYQQLLTSFSLGYQIINQRYIHGSGTNYFNWNVKLSGPVALLSFKF